MGFRQAYKEQIEYQRKVEGVMFKENLPIDNPKKFQYHVTALQEEIGEVLKVDKRWKTHRNNTYDKQEKLNEIADVFITAMNMSIWSGFDHKELMTAIESKIKTNNIRINSEASN